VEVGRERILSTDRVARTVASASIAVTVVTMIETAAAAVPVAT